MGPKIGTLAFALGGGITLTLFTALSASGLDPSLVKKIEINLAIEEASACLKGQSDFQAILEGVSSCTDMAKALAEGGAYYAVVRASSDDSMKNTVASNTYLKYIFDNNYIIEKYKDGCYAIVGRDWEKKNGPYGVEKYLYLALKLVEDATMAKAKAEFAVCNACEGKWPDDTPGHLCSKE